MLEKREFDKSDFLWRLSTSVTIVSGLFSVLIFILLLVNYLQIIKLDPVNHELLTHMRQEYSSLPEKDEVLAQRIRDLDLMTRRAFFTSQTLLHGGAWTLLGCVVVFLVAFKNMMRWRPQLPELADMPTADKEFLAYAQSRHLITWAGIGLLAGGMMTSYFTESALTAEMKAATLAESAGGEDNAVPPEAAAPAYVAPTWDEMAVNWPSFRGPGATGVAHFTTAPTAWNVEAGTDIRWSVDEPLVGNNSPVVWGDKLYMAGANAETREVYCFSTDNGELVWKQTVPSFPGAPTEEFDVMEDTGYAACTMAVHGDRVFAIFANGDLISYDSAGKQAWGRNLGLAENHYGHSSSLLAYENVLFVQYDQTENGKLYGLDVATGKETWAVPREKISWASPILARTPMGNQLILASEKNADAYDPATGALLWFQECLGGEVAPSPAYADSRVFVANEYAVASCITLAGTAEAMETAVAWEYDDLLTEISSPVGDGERFYFGTALGDIVCLDAKTGENLWTQEVDDGFRSSPILVGDRIYMADEGGTMHIFRASGTYESIAEIPLGAPALATPAYLDGRIYVRTPERLYCIEAS